jgi:hypothetical protein
MSSKKATMRATRTTAPSRPGSGQENSLAQVATATSTPSTLSNSMATLSATETTYQQEVASLTPLAVVAFTSEDIALNSFESTEDTSTQPFSQCDIATT